VEVEDSQSTEIITAGEMSEEAIESFSSINRLFQSSGEAGRTSGTMFLLKNGPDVTDEVLINTRELMDGGNEMIFSQGLRERLKGCIGRIINGLIHANTEDASGHGMVMWFRMKFVFMHCKIDLAKNKCVVG
jgi:hypothetical protein